MALEFAVKPTVTTTPIVTPSTEGNDFNTSFMNFVGDTLDAFTRMDIVLILRIILVWIAIVWLVFAIWAAIDASTRYRRWYIPILWFIFILPANILGFIGYMLIRPTLTLEEQEYLDLESKYIKYELLKVVECPQCGTVLDSDTHYCPNCGYNMLTKCPNCGYEQSIFNKHCIKCGVRLNTEIVVNKNVKVEDTKIVKVKKVKKSINEIHGNAVDNKSRSISINKNTPGGISPARKLVKRKISNNFVVNISRLNPVPLLKKGAIYIGNIAEKVGDFTIKVVTFPISFPVKVFKDLSKKRNIKRRKTDNKTKIKANKDRDNKITKKRPQKKKDSSKRMTKKKKAKKRRL